MTGYKRRCPRCRQMVGVWHLQPFDRYKHHLKPRWRLWVLFWWDRQLCWCSGGFEQIEEMP